MVLQMLGDLSNFMARGGWVMWPLAALSLVAVTLCLERAWFWLSHHQARHLRRIHEQARLMRLGQFDAARAMAAAGASVYDRLIEQLLAQPHDDDAWVAQVTSQQRVPVERFMATLSTIITAAPMLGILGTVTGIIASFNSVTGPTPDPAQVGAGIGQALLTTAVGLVIAIAVLLPFNWFRTQLGRSLDRMEMLTLALKQGLSKQGRSEQAMSTQAPSRQGLAESSASA